MPGRSVRAYREADFQLSNSGPLLSWDSAQDVRSARSDSIGVSPGALGVTRRVGTGVLGVMIPPSLLLRATQVIE